MELFDKAARGPLGSLKLLITRHSKRLLPYLAAAIVLVALLVDPFVQLILSFPSRGWQSPGAIAQVPSAKAFQSTVFQDGLASFTGDANGLFSAMSSAAFTAATGIDSLISITCSTSNCTWDRWTSLGVCGSCLDVTSSTKTECSGQGNLEDRIWCVSTLPSGRTVETSTLEDTDTQFFTWFNTTRNSTLMQPAPNRRDAQLNVWLVGVAPVITSFSAVKVVQWLNNTPNAIFSDCDLAFCSKHYSGFDVQNGQTLYATPTELPLVVSTAGVQAHSFSCDEATDPTCYPPGSPYVLELAQPLHASAQESFTIDLNGAQYWSDFMSDLFDLRWYESEFLTNSSNNLDPSNIFLRQQGWEAQPPVISQPLAVADDLDARIRMMASAFTNVLQNQSSNGTVFNGAAFENRTFIAVSWGWLALPIVLACASLALLLVVVDENRKLGLDVWKSDGVPLLFHQLEGWDAMDCTFSSIKGLKKKTKEMWGTLNDDRERRAFVRRPSRNEK